MKKKSVYLFMLLALFISIFYGCKKDKGNYTYTKINEMSIKKLDTTLYISAGDSIKLRPVIEQKNVSNGSYDYKWYIFKSNSSSDTSVLVLQKTKNLDVLINLSVGNYEMVFEVTDKSTKIRAFKTLFVKINRKNQNGIILLEATNQGGDISQISFNGIVSKNLYSNQNQSFINGTLGNLLGVYYDEGLRIDRPNFLYLSNPNQNTVELDWDTYKNLGSVEKMYGIIPNRPVEMQSIRSYAGLASVVDGKVHICSGQALPIYFEGIIPGDYKVSPYFIVPSNAGRTATNIPAYIFFDEKNGRFLIYNNYYSLSPLNEYFDDQGYYGIPKYDLSKLRNKHCIYAGYTNDFAVYNWFMKDELTGKLSIYKVGNSTFISAAKSIINPPNNSQLAYGKYFASSTALPHVYYAVDNQVYLYDYISNQEKIIYTFPIGETITDIKISVNRVSNFGTKNLADYTTGTIYVATYNGSSGTVSQFNILPTGLFGTLKAYTGFGKIASMYYK